MQRIVFVPLRHSERTSDHYKVLYEIIDKYIIHKLEQMLKEPHQQLPHLAFKSWTALGRKLFLLCVLYLGQRSPIQMGATQGLDVEYCQDGGDCLSCLSLFRGWVTIISDMFYSYSVCT